MSQRGVDEAGAEADRLASLVSRHAEALRGAALGSRFSLEGADFTLHATARNTIYRVSGRSRWFLKLPRDTDNKLPIEHEKIGAGVIDGALASHPDYSGAAVTKVSMDPAFVLAAAIPGQALNRLFFRNVWAPSHAAQNRLARSFAVLGQLLAVLHDRARFPGPAVPATTRPFKILDHLLARARSRDAVTESIADWVGANGQADDGDTFQHGNFRLDNILKTPSGLGFIDFENCGSGSQYQDLSRPLLDLVLTHALPLFPRRRADACGAAFLSAYAGSRRIDPEQLSKLVTARLARFYLESRARRFRVRIGGLPISKRKLERVVVAYLRSEPGFLPNLTSPPT